LSYSIACGSACAPTSLVHRARQKSTWETQLIFSAFRNAITVGRSQILHGIANITMSVAINWKELLNLVDVWKSKIDFIVCRISGCLKKYRIYNLFRIFAMCDHTLIYIIHLFIIMDVIFIWENKCNFIKCIRIILILKR